MALYLSVYTKKGITDDGINGTVPNLEENRPFLSLLSQESKMKPLYEKTIVKEHSGTFLRDESTTNPGIAQETNYWIARTGNTTSRSNFPNKSTPGHHFPTGNKSIGFPKNGDEMTEDLDGASRPFQNIQNIFGKIASQNSGMHSASSKMEKHHDEMLGGHTNQPQALYDEHPFVLSGVAVDEHYFFGISIRPRKPTCSRNERYAECSRCELNCTEDPNVRFVREFWNNNIQIYSIAADALTFSVHFSIPAHVKFK